MPKVLSPKPPDKRSQVDRFLERIKNNRVAAVVIIACLGVGALASLTDSVRKLSDALASPFSKSAAGEWKSDSEVFRPYVGTEFVRLNLTEPISDHVVGSIQFGGDRDHPPIAFPFAEGKRNGKSITLTLAGASSPTLAGELVGSELHLIYQHPERGAPFAATFHRIDQAAQLVDGHFAIVYQNREFPDHRSACTQLLSDHDPPLSYVTSDPPDAGGDVHCAGRRILGRWDFDQYENSIKRQLVCPPHTQVALIGGQVLSQSTRGCECEGTLAATAGKCAIHQ
jgi:hypothetical protein